jgi:hypothetical protein
MGHLQRFFFVRRIFGRIKSADLRKAFNIPRSVYCTAKICLCERTVQSHVHAILFPASFVSGRRICYYSAQRGFVKKCRSVRVFKKAVT